jgi:hypothetical protein
MSENKIEKWIVPHFSRDKWSVQNKVKLSKIILLSLKRLSVHKSPSMARFYCLVSQKTKYLE